MSRQRRRQSPALGRCRAMSTKVDTSRSRWRATSISGLWPDTLSATRCAPISSCERRNGGGQACGNSVILREERSLLAAWPIDMPANWLERVNQTDNAQELEALRRSVQRGRPFGQPEWQKEIAKRLGLESAYRPTGRPRRVGRNKMPRPGEDRSDVGGAAQFNNRTRPAFSPGPVPLSPPV